MHKFQFNIGAKIQCKDGECGELTRLVYDPHTQEITDLVVSEGMLFKTTRVIPAGLVDRTAPEDVFLTIERERYENFPEYREYEYETTEETPVETGSRTMRNAVYRVNPYGVPSSRPFFPTIRRHSVRQNVAPDAQVLERGTAVVDKDENKVGTLDHVLLDPGSCKITHLVVNRGVTSDSKVIPESMIEVISEDNIVLHIAEEELVDAPSYIPRGDEHILSEAQEYLKQRIEKQGMQISVDRGVMHLSGYVRSAADKRKAEAAARSIRGVVDVENNLRTDTQIQAVVSAALHADKRTELSIIEVESNLGVVILRGAVDDKEIASAAETIASLQPGVNMVMNELVVEHDEFTPYLSGRLGWEMEKMKDMSYFPGG